MSKIENVKRFILDSGRFSFRARTVTRGYNLCHLGTERVSRGTVNRALAELAADGLLEKWDHGRITRWHATDKLRGQHKDKESGR